MILNANIPLHAQQPLRQLPWRIGLYGGLTILGIIVGWGILKRLDIGIFTPQLETPSGMSMRITAENALWLTKNTQGLMINTTCPIDIPTLLSFKHPSWILLGDTNETTQITLKNSPPDLTKKVKNYHIAFTCTLEELPTKATFSLSTQGAWAWKDTTIESMMLAEQKVSIKFPEIKKGDMQWVPQQNLTTALPVQGEYKNNFPQTLQGVHDLFSLEGEIAFFSWETKNNEMAIAISMQKNVSDEIIRSLLYDIGNIPTQKEKLFRKDEIAYSVTKKEEIFITWKNETYGEVHTKNESIVGYIEKQENAILLSTAPTQWLLKKPDWKATLERGEAITHQAQTLANFGKEIVITKKQITIMN